jgi:hypothetical protein
MFVHLSLNIYSFAEEKKLKSSTNRKNIQYKKTKKTKVEQK